MRSFAARLVALLLLAVVLHGCAVAVGGYVYRQRLAFRQDFARQNAERDKAGLPPLAWCEELLKYDKSWYAEDEACRQAEPATPAAGRIMP